MHQKLWLPGSAFTHWGSYSVLREYWLDLRGRTQGRGGVMGRYGRRGNGMEGEGRERAIETEVWLHH